MIRQPNTPDRQLNALVIRLARESIGGPLRFFFFGFKNEIIDVVYDPDTALGLRDRLLAAERLKATATFTLTDNDWARITVEYIPNGRLYARLDPIPVGSWVETTDRIRDEHQKLWHPKKGEEKS